jgi:hypothetical protein
MKKESKQFWYDVVVAVIAIPTLFFFILLWIATG